MKHRHQGWGWSLGLAALLLAGCGNPDEAQTLGTAKDYMAKREFKAAAIELKNVLQENPSSAEARYLLGKSLLESGDAKGAEQELRRARELQYPDASAAPELARALLAQGQFRKLIDELADVAIQDSLAGADLQTSVAAALAMQGSMEKARTRVEMVLDSEPRYAPALILSARFKVSGGDIDGALAILEQVLARGPGDLDALRFKGDLLLQAKRDAPGAIAVYRSALAIKPEQPAIHDTLVAVYLQQRDMESAKKELEALKKLQPKGSQTRYYEAQMEFAQANYKAARDLVQEALTRVPGNVRYLNLAGAIELQLGELLAAQTLLDRAVQLAPNFGNARRLLAQTYVQLRQPAKALATLRPMLEQPNVGASILKLAAQAQLQAGDKKAAQAMLARAAKLKPDDKSISAAIALSNLAPGDSGAALGELQKIAASDDGVKIDLALIATRIQRRQLDEALQAIDALERKQPNSAQAAEMRARVQLLRNDPAAARKSLEQALTRDPGYLNGVTGLAGIDLQQGKPEAARTRLEEFIERDPKNPRAHLALAEIKRRSGAGPEEVAKAFADAVRAIPANSQIRAAQVEYLLGVRNGPAALAAAQAAVVVLPENAELHASLGRAQFATGDRQQAVVSFRKVIALRPDSAQGHLGLATVHVAAQELDAADREARRALELEPDSTAAQRLAVSTALRRNQPKEALAMALALQKRRPADAAGFLMEGEIEFAGKNWDLAATAFRKALTKAEPGQAAARLHAALLAGAKIAEAGKFSDSWLKEHPADAQFLLYLGDLALAQRDYGVAQARYQEVSRLQPDNALPLNNIAWILLQQKKPGALALAERAVKLAPDQPILRDTLAMVLSSEKQHARAIEIEKKVVAQSPGVHGYRLNLARIYIDAGDKVSARDELDALAKLGAEFRAQDEVTKLLKSIGAI